MRIYKKEIERHNSNLITNIIRSKNNPMIHFKILDKAILFHVTFKSKAFQTFTTKQYLIRCNIKQGNNLGKPRNRTIYEIMAEVLSVPAKWENSLPVRLRKFT